MSRLTPIHPGEILTEEFLRPAGLSAAELAGRTGLPAVELTAIAEGRGRVSLVIAEALGAYFHTGADFWINLQLDFEERRSLDGVLEKLSRFDSDFMNDDRGEQEQDER